MTARAKTPVVDACQDSIGVLLVLVGRLHRTPRRTASVAGVLQELLQLGPPTG